MTSLRTEHSDLPDGTLCDIRYDSDPSQARIVVVRGGSLYGPSDFKERHPHLWGNEHSDHYLSLRVLLPVPDGMTPADAEAALADAGAWVEVDQATFNDAPTGARIRQEWSAGKGLSTDAFYVHRDDLPPTDPDAELVEKMARAAHDQPKPVLPWDERDDMVREMYRAEARAALAVVREHEATR